MALIGHWRAADESGGSIPDLSGGGLNGTVTAGCSVVTLPVTGEAAIRCPLGSDGIEIADDAKWDLGDFTLLCRFQQDDYATRAPLITHTPGAGLVDKWLFCFLTGVPVGGVPCLVLQGRAPAGFQVKSNPYNCTYNSPVTAWVKRSGTDVTFGVNDVTVGTATFGTTFTSIAEPLRLGSGQETTFDGPVSIIAARVYDTALSDDDIQAAYLADAVAPLPTPTPNTQIGRWRAYDDEGSGLAFPSRLDAVPDGAIGTTCAWVTLEDCPAVLCDTVAGPPSPGLTNQAECITVRQDPRWRIDGGDFTLIARMTFDDPVHIEGIAGCNEGLDGNDYFPMWAFVLNPPAGAQVMMFTWTEAGNANVRHTATSSSFTGDLTASTWGLAVVRSGDTFHFYAWDGTTFQTLTPDTESGALPADLVAPLYLGRGGNQSRDGGDTTVASFRMYNYALDAAAVEAAMLEDTICTRPPQATARVLADCGDPIFVNACPDPDAP